jgi:hypothetical protein
MDLIGKTMSNESLKCILIALMIMLVNVINKAMPPIKRESIS